MKVLVAGATGATVCLLVELLLDIGQEVTVIVRPPDKLSEPSLLYQCISNKCNICVYIYYILL